MIRAELERRERCWSKSEVARRTGINQVTVIEILNGTRRPSPSYAPRFGAAFGWPEGRAAELLEEIDNDA